MSLKITFVKFLPRLPGANDFGANGTREPIESVKDTSLLK